ncbi:MAG: hypothetical protein R2729_32255 [Bryobacteraceae bacterium]
MVVRRSEAKKAADSANAARQRDLVNYSNIGLMAAAAALALILPFELFLFAYAVLGPAHYLTEISWLHKRGFFMRWQAGFLLLSVLAIVMFSSAPPAGRFFTPTAALCTAVALGAGAVLASASTVSRSLTGLAAVALVSYVVVQTFGFAAAFLALFVPTLIHVYVFTGLFMLYGALKDESYSGYTAFGCFLLFPLLFVVADVKTGEPAPYVVVSYWKSFSLLNLSLLGLDIPSTREQGGAAGLAVFTSPTGLKLMRFIAFAYTYHYLNWFSKTSVIRWHDASTARLAGVAALWAASVGLYVFDYSTGVQWLLCLSYMHVYLEFPLNYLSITGTYSQVRSRLAGAAAGRPAAASG